MPICPTCQGEYVRQECLCPACGQTLGEAPSCQNCGQPTGGRRLCPRCHSDVVGWEEERLSLVGFIVLRGGFIGLLPTIVVVLVEVFYWARLGDSIHHPVASVLSIILSLFVFYGLFSVRYGLWERSWAARVYQVAGPPLMVLGLGALGLGMLCALMSFALYVMIAPPIEFPLKMIFILVYVTAFVSLTAGLTIFILQHYLNDLDTRLPQPIFVHTDRLLEIVMQSVARLIQQGEPGRAADGPASQRTAVRFEIVSVTRIPRDGSIHILAREGHYVRWTSPDAQPRPQWTEWSIEADRWGRLRALKPRATAHAFPPRVIIGQER